MKSLPARAVSHVITDPPYEAEAHTLQRRIKASASRGATWQKTGGVVVVEPLSFVPITADVRTAVGFEFARLAERWTLAFCQVEAAMAWRDAIRGDDDNINGANYRRTCVWVKPDGMPQLTGDRPGMGYESIVTCHRIGRSRWHGGGRCGVFVHNKNENSGHSQPHPTTKPLPLMLELVALFTDPGEVVLDPFAGSGTTGVAAMRLGRRVVLIEKDEQHAAVARERMLAEESGSTFHAQRAGQVALFDVGPKTKMDPQQDIWPLPLPLPQPEDA